VSLFCFVKGTWQRHTRKLEGAYLEVNVQNGEIEQESYIENENDVEKLFDEMLNDNPHIITYAQKALLRCWCRLLLHLQDMVVNREWARYLSELTHMS